MASILGTNAAGKSSEPRPRPSGRIIWVAIALGALALALLLAPSIWA
jgi:hypothetical protein